MSHHWAVVCDDNVDSHRLVASFVSHKNRTADALADLREFAKSLAVVLNVHEQTLYAANMRFTDVSSGGLNLFRIIPADESP